MKQNGQLPTNNWKGEFFNKYDSVKAVRQLKEHYSFLKEVDSISLQKSVENLADAYQRYYRKQNKMPCFKSKKTRCNPIACRVHHQRDINAGLNLRNEALRLLTAGTAGLA